MFSLLGALFVGAWVFGRHGFRALTRGVLFGVLVGIFGKRNFDMNRVREDVHDKVRDVRKTVKKAVKDAKKEMRDTGKAQRAAWEGRVAERLERAEARIDAARARQAEREVRVEERLEKVHERIAAEKARQAEREARLREHMAQVQERLAAEKVRHVETEQKIREEQEAVRVKMEAQKEERRLQAEERMARIHAEIEARKALREQKVLEEAEARKEQESRRAEAAAVPAEPVVMEIPGNGNEALENRELVEELERNARTAAMASDVPVIEFPEEDDRYFSAKKYGYA